ncbi:MAG: hypothetical protein KKH52_03620 [Nanoarchaeota archaeon]|nr:hypothetical protein [Nanoarchaeota archaeon]
MIKIEKIKSYHQSEEGESFTVNNEGRPTISILKRNKGSISGEHYHIGKTKSKNPEVFVLLSGKIEVYVEDLKTKESKTVIIKKTLVLKFLPMFIMLLKL